MIATASQQKLKIARPFWMRLIPEKSANDQIV